MLASLKRKTNFGQTLALLLIPHHHNDHHPFLIRHFSLFLISGVVVGTQFFSNLQAGQIRVLGFASSIYQNEIVNLTNQQRNMNGAGNLSENSLLDSAAAKKASDMFSKNYWSHFAPDGTSPWYFFNLVGYKYTWAGENLARDFQTSEGVVQGWMNSPTHKENLLNKNYTEIGVAIVNGTLQGEETTLVVQLFGKPTSTQASSLPSNKTNKSSNSEQVNATPKSVSDKFVLDASKKSSPSTAAASTTKVSSSFDGRISIFQSVNALPLAAKAELFLLVILFSVFLVDSFILYKRRINRVGSHSFIHAIVIAILIASILVTSKGKLI